MAYSEEGYALAQTTVMVCLIRVVDRVAPGVLRGLYDKATVELSEFLEHNPESQRHKDALFLIADWSEQLSEGKDDIKTSILGQLVDVEGRVAAESMRLACLMDAIDALHPGTSDKADKRALEHLQKLAEKHPTSPYVIAAAFHMERDVDSVRGQGEFAKKE